MMSGAWLAAGPQFGPWVPFVTPAPLWDLWPLLIVPLLLAISFAYKATKSATPRALVVDALRLSGFLLAALVAAAVILALLIRVVG